MEKAMINLTINDRPIEVPEGTTVLEAARKLGFTIPTLCRYDGVKPYGGCRICLVEVTQGNRIQLTASCTYPAAEGLVVRTDTDEVLEARRFVMDLLLSRGPEVPGLEEMARQLGVEDRVSPGGQRLHPLRQMRAHVPRGPTRGGHRFHRPGRQTPGYHAFRGSFSGFAAPAGPAPLSAPPATSKTWRNLWARSPAPNALSSTRA